MGKWVQTTVGESHDERLNLNDSPKEEYGFFCLSGDPEIVWECLCCGPLYFPALFYTTNLNSSLLSPGHEFASKFGDFTASNADDVIDLPPTAVPSWATDPPPEDLEAVRHPVQERDTN